MATLTQRVTDLATAVGTKLKELHTKIGPLTSLPTTDKASIVASLIEIKADLDELALAAGATINDASASSLTQTWSITKIAVEIQAAKDAILGGAGTAFDTLKELADALGNDANLSSTLLTDIGKRVRFDAAQTLTTGEKLQARENIDAQSKSEIGFADNSFVDTLNTAMA